MALRGLGFGVWGLGGLFRGLGFLGSWMFFGQLRVSATETLHQKLQVFMYSQA